MVRAVIGVIIIIAIIRLQIFLSKKDLNTHKPQVCYKHVFNKFLLNSIRNKE